MEEEYATLMSNDTSNLVLRPRGTNVVTSKWIFKHKFEVNGTLKRYKAHLVLRRFTPRPDVDYDENFSPVVKSVMIRTVMSLALSRDWPIH
jgi:hypothetical protein